MKFYSPSTKGFYDPNIHDNIPSDSVEITDEYWSSLQGKQIIFDGNLPVEKTYSEEELQLRKILDDVFNARSYLRETDYKMTSDYDKDITEVKIKRAEARALIREYENNHGTT